MDQIFKLFLKGFIPKFSRFGRYLDLIAGLGCLALAYSWQSIGLAVAGAVGLIAFAVDLNGIIQRKTMALAISKARKR